ncbi:MAG: precorrin-2 dehydrogenase [Nitrospirales bacterium]|nr:MAG: precorrin-2 dehydrogenase [Nitrospirales bacterium]
MEFNPGFQVSLNVQGRSCLVLGGEDEAVEKIERLLDAGAKVTVIHPTLHAILRKYTASGRIIHRGRMFRITDVQNGVTAVMNTVAGDHDLAKQLYELSKTEHFLVWSIDQPDLSTFTMPALVKRGHLRVAISTSGASPSLAKALRQDLDTVLDEELVDILDWLSTVRANLRDSEPSERKRREQLQQIIEGFRLSGTLEYPKAWQEQRLAHAVKES